MGQLPPPVPSPCLDVVPTYMHAWRAGEEKRSSEDRARADLQCQQLQQQVHVLQSQLQGAQGQAAEAHRLRMDSCVLADRLLEQACHRLSALEPQLQSRISHAEKVCVSGAKFHVFV